MSRYNHPHKMTRMKILVHTLLGAACVAILTMLCPHEATNKLSYHLNEPWENDVLIARDSFDVFKSQGEIQREKDSLRMHYEPYYDIQPEVAATVIRRFHENVDSLVRGNSSLRLVRNNLESDLLAYYEAGIMSDEDYQRLEDEGTSFIHKRHHPDDITCAKEKVHSVKAVLEELFGNSTERQLLLQNTNLNTYLAPNLKYNKDLSDKQKAEIDKFATSFAGRVVVGEKIVDKGQIVTQEVYNKLQSYEKHELERGRTSRELLSQTGGNAIYILLMVVALYLFFYQFRSDYLHTRKYSLLIYILFLAFPAACFAMASHNFLNIYVVPYCMVPIFLRVFMDSRTAFITHLTCVMLCALATNHPFEFISIQILAGLMAIYSLKQLQQRSELFRTVLLVTGVSLLVNLCMDLLHMNFFNNVGIDGANYVYICVNGLLLFISYLILFPIEKTFGFTSTVTLVELSNINHPILRRLSEEAPGTFQHSMQVANLAAAVANELGAKSQLVRTGALYHDIGKLKNPVYFTENQSGTNPHNQLSYVESAQVIIQHVRNGLELANKYNLPSDIKKLITSHHGRSKTKFFYISYRNENPDKEVNDEIFTYPGPNPTTIEQAILMMADSVEAASRSLKEYTEESISKLVENIIDAQLQEGYFRQCDITFANIDQAKQTFKNKLKSIYHTRITYPELKK